MTQEQKDAHRARQEANANMGAAERKAASEAQGFTGHGGLTGPMNDPNSVAVTPTPYTPPSVAPSVPRDTQAEAQTVKTLGFVPTTDAEILDAAIMTYGSDPAMLPDYFVQLQDKIKAAAASKDQAALTAAGQDITALGQSGAAMQGLVDEQAGMIPGELGYLQNALKMVSGVGSQPLGESDIFKQAGVGGYGALSSSLAAHGQEMDFKYTSFANMVNQAAKLQYGENSKYAAQAKAALDQYAILQDSYRYEQSRLDDIAARTEAVQNELYTYGEKLKMDLAYEDAKNATTELGVGGQITTSQAQTVFNIIPTGKYANGSQFHKGQAGWELGTNTWECGEGYNQITDGPRAGSTLQEKLAMRDLSITSPSVGNGLILPLGEDTGHIETVISNNNGLIQTVSWNRNLDGQQTIQTYTIDELNSKYGKNWGFTNSTLKPEYQQALAEASGPTSDPYSYASFYQEAISDGRSPESAEKYATDMVKSSSTWANEFSQKQYIQYTMLVPEEETYAEKTGGMADEELETYAENNGAFAQKLVNREPDDELSTEMINKFFTDPEERALALAQKRWVAAKLRGESGAAISVSEYLDAMQSFWPQSGDDAEEIKRKEDRRITYANGVKDSLDLYGKKLLSEQPKEVAVTEQEDPDVLEYNSFATVNDPDYQEWVSSQVEPKGTTKIGKSNY